MEFVYKIIFYISAFIIFWAMVGYPVSIKIIGRLFKDIKNVKNYNLKPTVTVMVVAHNEENVIKEKLINIINLDYPKDRIEYLIVSDNSTDQTNKIVLDFIKEHPEERMKLYEVKQRKGKTNAQNEGHKTVTTEFLIMTDANSILDRASVIELMSSFTSDKIAYVSGKLSFINNDISNVSSAESSYWDLDTEIRDIEGRLQTITAGNGALYACRTKDYYDFDPIKSHDSSMPLFYALRGRRAIANHQAKAYEKAGENIKDEFSRKVRMNRIILNHILPDIRILNFVKYKWFTYFYLGHRTCRYLLWVSHLLLFMSSGILMLTNLLYTTAFILQMLFYSLAIIKYISKSNLKFLNLPYYYCVTIAAQWVGVFNVITGRTKPFWEKAESTR